LRFMTLSSHRAPFTSSGTVIAHLRGISVRAFARSLTYKLHPLSHWAYIEIPLLLVVQVLLQEGIVLLCTFLLFVEVIVFDIPFYLIGFQHFVVLLTAVPCIGDHHIALTVVVFFEALKVFFQRRGIAGRLVDTVMGNELLLSTDLSVVGGL